MPWFEVPVRIWVEADDAPAAMDLVMDGIPDGRIIETDDVREVNPDDMESFLSFTSAIEKSAEDADKGIFVSDPRHPGVKFSPQAAAQLIALEAENGKR
jgi:hypothetical protein